MKEEMLKRKVDFRFGFFLSFFLVLLFLSEGSEALMMIVVTRD